MQLDHQRVCLSVLRALCQALTFPLRHRLRLRLSGWSTRRTSGFALVFLVTPCAIDDVRKSSDAIGDAEVANSRK